MSGDDKKLAAAEKAEAKPTDMASEVQKRAKSMCAALNKNFAAERKSCVEAAKKALKAKLEAASKDKKVDPKKLKEEEAKVEARIPSYAISLNKMRVSAGARSGKDQAWYAIMGWSKTCRSAHMHHAAIHVNIKVTRGTANKDIGLKQEATYFPSSLKPTAHLDEKKPSWAIMDRATFEKHWVKGLKTAVLADCTGASQRYVPADPWHVELPSSKMAGIPDDKKTGAARPGYSDKEVLACVDTYAEYAAHIDALEDDKTKKKHKKNTTIEKNYKKTFDKKYEAHKKKLDTAKKAVEKDATKKQKKQDDIAKKANAMKGRMAKTYKELVELEKAEAEAAKK